jgi:hypothetical protein
MRTRQAHSLVASLLLIAFLALGTVTLGHAVTHADPGDCAACAAVTTTPTVLVAAALLAFVTMTTPVRPALAPARGRRSHHAPPALRGPPSAF